MDGGQRAFAQRQSQSGNTLDRRLHKFIDPRDNALRDNSARQSLTESFTLGEVLKPSRHNLNCHRSRYVKGTSRGDDGMATGLADSERAVCRMAHLGHVRGRNSRAINPQLPKVADL